MMVFLTQPEYDKQVGVTPMSDYRFTYRADFDHVHLGINQTDRTFEFVMKAVKPSRCTANADAAQTAMTFTGTN